MNLFSIPEEVFYHNIWPYLEWNDLLRYRRVSKMANVMILRFLRSRPDWTPELEINDTTKSLEKFLKMGIPTTKLYINNQMSGTLFFERNGTAVTKFLNRYGLLIKDLRIAMLTQYSMGEERAFFDRMTNLTTLVVHDLVGLSSRRKREAKKFLRRYCDSDNSGTKYIDNDKLFPDVFKQLQRLDINLESECVNMASVTIHSLSISRCCHQVEEISVPFSFQIIGSGLLYQMVLNYPPGQHNLVLAAFFHNLNTDLKDRIQNAMMNPNSKWSPLRKYSFKNFYHDDQNSKLARVVDVSSSSDFLELCETCVVNGVNLEMVNSAWFECWKVHECENENIKNEDLGNCVTSMVNLHPSAIGMKMPNLEKLVILSTSRSCVAIGCMFRPEWPSLKALDVTIDSLMMDEATQVNQVVGEHLEYSTHNSIPSESLFGFLFCEVKRPQVVELTLTFDIPGGKSNAPAMPPPKTATLIVSSCPNLKRLRLKNWPGTNKSLTILWSGLPALEEICLESCRDLGNVAFVGEDVQTPVFFQLKRLKKLSLLGLDKMPKITDTIFKLVLCHMSLTHLTFSSRRHIKTITPSGIRALLQGKFALSIEKFSFTGWSLANFSRKEQASLAKEFRSYQMI